MSVTTFARHGAVWLIEAEPITGLPFDPARVADTWLAETLRGGGDLIALLPSGAAGIWQGNAPRGTDHPSVSYWFSAAEENTHTTGSGVPALVQMRYVVEGWDMAGHFANLYPLFPLMVELLDVSGVDTAYGKIVACTWLLPWHGLTNFEV